MGNSLLLQKGGRISLFVRYTDRYHIIAVNKKLDEANETLVLSGSCSDAVMDELGLTRETIMKQDLRSVAIGGCSAGDTIVLYAKGKKLKYVLSDDCSEDDIHTMFEGIERVQAHKKKHREVNWRTELQDGGKLKTMRRIGTVCNSVGWVYFFGTFFFDRMNGMWFGLGLLFMGISVGLYFLYPQYFTILDRKTLKRKGCEDKVTSLAIAIVWPGLMMMVQLYSDFYFPNWTPLIIAGVAMGLVLTILMYLFAREVRGHTAYIVSVLVISVLMSLGIVGQFNHVANVDGEKPQAYTVIDTVKEKSRRSHQYYCIVLSEYGEEMKLPIDRSAYDTLRSGDVVTAYVGEGALGIEYAYFVEKLPELPAEKDS